MEKMSVRILGRNLDSTTNTLIIKGNSNETYIFDKTKNTTQESQISPILKVYMDKEANPNGYIEIHNFAKENIGDRNTYILGNDCNQRYCGITLFLNKITTPHNTDCSNEGNFQVIVQNLDRYGLDKGDTLYLYSCENRKGVSVKVDDNYSATFSITLDLPEQDEISKRCLSSHIILTTNPIKNTETIEEQMIHSNPHFQVNKSAKLAKQYIITDARLNTKKQPIAVKEVVQQLRVKAIGYREKYLHYSVNSIVKLEAQYNLKNPPQDKIGQTKWAYILTNNKTAPTQKQLNEKQYKHFIQRNDNEQYTGNNIDFRIQKEWLDIDKPKYLYIYAYLNAPSTKTSLCIIIQYPLSLRFNGKELQILEWGEVKREKIDSHIFDKRNENTAYYRIYSKEHDIIEKQDIPKLLSSYSLLSDIIDIEKYYKSNHYKEQDVIESIKQDTSLPKGSYYLYIKDIEESLKIRTDYLYTRAKGYKALNIYTIDTPNNQYKISYFNNPLDNIPYPKGTTFLTAPNTPIPTHYTDERVKIFLKGSNTYKNFILNLKQKIDNLKTQGYEIDKVKLEVGYESVDEQLSKYFTLTEVVKTNQKTSQFTKEQLTEFNRKEAMIVENYKKLQSLAKECDKIVDWIGYKPRVNSGVRVDIVNENLPNSSKKGKSQHTKCEALDLGFNSKDDLKKVYLAIHNNIIPNLNNQVFSQVILEKFSSSKIGWLHIALKTPKWSRGTEFKISYDGSSYVDFDKTQNMVDKF